MCAFHKYKLPPKIDVHTNSYKPKPEENKNLSSTLDYTRTQCKPQSNYIDIN